MECSTDEVKGVISAKIRLVNSPCVLVKFMALYSFCCSPVRYINMATSNSFCLWSSPNKLKLIYMSDKI